MAVARTRCVALVGVTGRMVEVEADVGPGVAGTHFIGLLDTATSEARGRVRSALINSRFAWPDTRITVSLFPASLPKRGSIFDLAIAVAVLGAAGAVPAHRIADPLFLGELGLDGGVRPVRGVLPAVLAAAEAGIGTVVVPARNAAEAALVPGVTVLPVARLGELVRWLRTGDPNRTPIAAGPSAPSGPSTGAADGYPAESVPDMRDVAGQPLARRALEVCAAGGHNLWMVGPPGTGKTMLAERLPALLPPLGREEALQASAIHSVAGTLPAGRPLLARPPFVAPHHSATVASVVGGGSGGTVRPGAVSLAHRGVLFLDEAPEFAASVLESLRQPLESGTVTIARASGTITFPARFMLVLAANPCPCGRPGTPREPCRCTPGARRRYLARLSGPLLDRIDVKVRVGRATRAELLADRHFAESTEVVARRVLLARERAAGRLAGTPWRANAEVPSAALHDEFRLPRAALAPLHRGLDLGALGARGLDRVLRMSWTLADLAGREIPGERETSGALAMWLGVD